MYSHFNSFSSSPSFIALLPALLSESYEDLVLSLFPFPFFLWKTNSFYCHVYRREGGKALTSSLLSLSFPSASELNFCRRLLSSLFLRFLFLCCLFFLQCVSIGSRKGRKERTTTRVFRLPFPPPPLCRETGYLRSKVRAAVFPLPPYVRTYVRTHCVSSSCWRRSPPFGSSENWKRGEEGGRSSGKRSEEIKPGRGGGGGRRQKGGWG